MDDVEKYIVKNFGKDILTSAHAVVDREKVVIPVSPKLDLILGGGISEGSFVIFTGQPKVGKSFLSLDFASTCQRPEFGGEFCPEGRDVYYYNIEGRLKKRDLEGIPGLNLDKFHIIESKPGKILHGEEYLQIEQTLISNKPGSVHINDSFSALCTEAEITTEMNQMQRADGAKLLYKFCRKVSNIIPVNNNIVIGVTHLIGNPTGYGKAFKEKSGQAIAYQVDTKLHAVSMKPWKNSNEEQIGQETEWQCVTSSLGPPGKKTTSYLRYGGGIDKEQELVSLATDIGLISKAGSWLTLDFINGDKEDKPKFQGLEKARQAIVDNPEWKECLENKIKELM